MRGHHHPDDADLVASPPAPHVRNAHAVQLDLLTRLHAGRDIDHVLPVDGGHRDVVAQHRLRNGDRQLEHDVLTVPHQLRMRPHAEPNVQVADRATARPHLALTAETERHVLVDARRNGHLDRVPHLDAALAPAVRARILDDAALTATLRTGRGGRHLAEDRLHGAAHLSRALACRALFRFCPGASSAAMALLALAGTRYLDGPLATEHHFLECDLDVHAQICATLRSAPTAPAAGAPAKEHVEEVEGRIEGERSEVRWH